MTDMNKPPCPKCNSELILDITYGYPGPEADDDKLFYSGGCCIDSESPAFHCTSCGHDFGKIDFSKFSE